MMNTAARFGVAIGLGLLAMQLTGCSSTIKPDGAAKSVTDLVSSQTGFHPTDVTCPSGVEAKVGTEFDCHFSGPEGPYTAHMKITKVDGDNVEFDIKTRPTNPTVKPDVAAKSVVDLVTSQTGFHPTDVTCPSGVEAKVGSEFDCHFTGPEGPYTAHVRVSKVDGDNVEFDIKTAPTNPTTPTVRPEAAAQTVVDFVSSQTGFHPTDVTCPSGVQAVVGGEFDCHFTGPEGPYTAHMRITKVDGQEVDFDIDSHRS